MGYWPSKIPCILNIVMQTGFGIITCIIAGQMLSAVNGAGLTIALGCVISAICTGLIASFGIKFLHIVERWAPQTMVIFPTWELTESQIRIHPTNVCYPGPHRLGWQEFRHVSQVHRLGGNGDGEPVLILHLDLLQRRRLRGHQRRFLRLLPHHLSQMDHIRHHVVRHVDRPRLLQHHRRRHLHRRRQHPRLGRRLQHLLRRPSSSLLRRPRRLRRLLRRDSCPGLHY